MWFKNHFSFWLSFVLLCTSVLCSDVFVKIDDNLALQGSCLDAKSALTNFFRDAALSLFDISGQRTSFDNVRIRLPNNWKDCGSDVVSSQIFPDEAAQVWIRNSSQGAVWQTEGCEQLGLGVLLEKDVFAARRSTEQVKKTFVLNWLKYYYGVFSESGQEGSFMYPAFYKNGREILPTSCTDKPIRGNFTDDCIWNGGTSVNCSIDADQSHITSSLLYSTDTDIFPQISKLCNSSNHDTKAQNQQNWLCQGRSPSDVMALKTSSVKRTIAPPNVTFVQGFNTSFILILDQSPKMAVQITTNANRWQYARQGLAQMFHLLLRSDIKDFCLIKSSATDSCRNVLVNDTGLPTFIFKESLPQDHPASWSLKTAITTALNQISENTILPNILIITATPVEEDDLTSTINLILDRKIKVDVVTFSNVQSPTLLNLTPFGAVYAIHETAAENTTKVIHEVGSIMRQLATSWIGNSLQDVVASSTNALSLTRGDFTLVTDRDLQSEEIKILVITPFANTPDIVLTAPNGNVYSTDQSDFSIAWTNNVLFAKFVTVQTGRWSYTIQSSQPTSQPQSIYVTVSVSSNVFLVRSFPESSARMSPVDVTGVGPPKVTLFSQVDMVRETNEEVRVEGTICTPNKSECFTITLRDDGLTVPDITRGDGIFSQYFTKLNYTGFYSTRFQAIIGTEISRFWTGPSFYLDTTLPEAKGDNIPPSRITDLRIRTYAAEKKFISLEWTAPGDDFNEGNANHYKIACGLSAETVSYDSCDKIRGTIKFAQSPGSLEQMNRTIMEASFDRTIYFGVIAVDGDVNESPMSNMATLFIDGPTTTTTPRTTASIPTTQNATSRPTTTGSNDTQQLPSTISDWSNETSTIGPHENSSSPIPDISANDDKNLYFTTGEFVSIVAALSGVLLLFICLMTIYVCLRARKKRIADKLYRDTLGSPTPKNIVNGGPHHHHQHQQHPHHRILSPNNFDVGSGYQMDNGLGDVGSGSLYIDGVGNPIGKSRGRKSDYEYRVSRIETPPIDLVVRSTSGNRHRSRSSRRVPESISSISPSSSSSDSEVNSDFSQDRTKHFVGNRRTDLSNRSSKSIVRAGRPNHGYVESPTPAEAFSRNRTPVAARRQIEQNRLIDELSAGNLQRKYSNNPGSGRTSKRIAPGHKMAGNGVLLQTGSNSSVNKSNSREQINYYQPHSTIHGREDSVTPVIIHGRDDSMGSASTAATFQRIDFDPQSGLHPSHMTRILDVDGSERLDLDPQIRENEPFNYIAFSQQLYGQSNRSETPKQRAISFV